MRLILNLSTATLADLELLWNKYYPGGIPATESIEELAVRLLENSLESWLDLP